MNSTLSSNHFETCFVPTEVAVMSLVTNSILCAVALCVFNKMMALNRQDNSEMEDLFLCYAKLNILFLPPTCIIKDGLIPFLYPLSENIGPWFCHVSVFVAYFFYDCCCNAHFYGGTCAVHIDCI